MNSTAYPWRFANWDVHISCSYQLGNEKQKQELREFQDNVLQQLGADCQQAYLNFQDAEREDWQQAYYGPHLNRLLALKAQWNSIHSGTPLRFWQELPQ